MVSAPTRREVFLVVFLLVTLLLLSRSDFDFSFSRAPRPKFDYYSKDNSGLLWKPPTEPQSYRTSISWEKSQVPETKVVAHAPGWTIFDNLYLHNGTFIVVTDKPDELPDREHILSIGINIENGKEEEEKRLPSDKDMRNVSTKAAAKLFGSEIDVFDGATWLVNDPPQFIQHYYHWSAELFFGFWRAYSSLDPLIKENGSTTLPAPRRMWFHHADADHWRDYASMNQLVLRSAFPSMTMEFLADWQDRMALGRPLVFDRVVIGDRSAAMHGYNYVRTQRTASEAFALPGSAHWWNTVRRNVVDFGTPGLSENRPENHVITYVSRQEWGRRMLIPEDHDKLVEELYKLRDEYGYEVNVVSMDKLSQKEQIRLSARTTIMMGVHGNGLTSLVWMKPTPRSTVMEFFFPGGFAHDYEYTTRALGMVHYGFWGAEHFTSPQTPDVAYPEGFQGNSIPLDGAMVARLCHQRLSLADEADD